MTKTEKLQLLRDISRLERELELKKGKLAQEQGRRRDEDQRQRWRRKDWGKEFADLIEQIGRRSRGGNSVEDARKERDG